MLHDIIENTKSARNETHIYIISIYCPRCFQQNILKYDTKENSTNEDKVYRNNAHQNMSKLW